ncbi:unnamed protein product [Toxocara canis]|uniref:Uncharacterized protein n=1 Tax=Toxocara canis TaxID=6265 RepID=A0A183V0K0_TOXCA|nr:unnamed protein product [Toxocara canis]
MKKQFNRRHGAHDAATSRSVTPSTLGTVMDQTARRCPAPSHAKLATLCVAENSFGRGTSTSKSTPTVNQLLDVFDLPLLNSEAGKTSPTPVSSLPVFAVRRSMRIRHARR